MPASSPLSRQRAAELQRYVPDHRHAAATGSNCQHPPPPPEVEGPLWQCEGTCTAAQKTDTRQWPWKDHRYLLADKVKAERCLVRLTMSIAQQPYAPALALC